MQGAVRVVHRIKLVKHQNLRNIGCANVSQYPLNFGHLLNKVGARRIHHMQQQIGIHSLLQCSLKRVNQTVGQVADEAHGIRQRNRALGITKVELAGRGVERRK